MSETSQGPGWWQASDGKWYAPEQRLPPAAPGPRYAGGRTPYQPGYAGAQPYPQVIVQQKKGHGCLWALLGAAAVIVVLVVVIVVAASSGSDKLVVPSSVTSGTTPPGPVHAVGETARTSDFEVTVYGFMNPQAPGVVLPTAGRHFVSVDVQVTNVKADQQTFYGFFRLFDAANHQYSEALSLIDPGPPGGLMAPGQSIRGIVVFEIFDSTQGPFKLQALGSVTAAGAVYALG